MLSPSATCPLWVIPPGYAFFPSSSAVDPKEISLWASEHRPHSISVGGHSTPFLGRFLSSPLSLFAQSELI
jgi:hypothetical protein